MATYTFRIENGDIVDGGDLGLGGGVALLSGSDKFAQDIRGILRTNRSGVPRIVGREGTPFEVRAAVTQAITQALENFKRLQQSRQQSRRSRTERFAGISRLEVFPNKNDPRRYKFQLDTFSEAGATARTNLTTRQD